MKRQITCFMGSIRYGSWGIIVKILFENKNIQQFV